MGKSWLYWLLSGFSVFACIASTQAKDIFTEQEIALYQEHCAVCHEESDEQLGPSHANVFGSPAGSVKNFPYSEEILQSGLIWNRETLLLFLKDPESSCQEIQWASWVDSLEERNLIVNYLMKLKNNQ